MKNNEDWDEEYPGEIDDVFDKLREDVTPPEGFKKLTVTKKDFVDALNKVGEENGVEYCIDVNLDEWNEDDDFNLNSYLSSQYSISKEYYDKNGYESIEKWARDYFQDHEKKTYYIRIQKSTGALLDFMKTVLAIDSVGLPKGENGEMNAASEQLIDDMVKHIRRYLLADRIDTNSELLHFVIKETERRKNESTS